MPGEWKRGILRLSIYLRDGFRRYVAWIGPYLRYLARRVGVASDRRLVVISSYQHPYVRNLRQSVGGRVLFMPRRQPGMYTPSVPMEQADIFHLHFINELGLGLDETTELIAQLRTTGTRIVWTGHDLISHDKDYERFEPLFASWAKAADGVIHHTHYGEQLMRGRYSFRDDCEHTVINHAYRREHSNLRLREMRAEIEHSYGIQPAPIRIGLMGMPRVERDVLGFLEGVAASTNRDVQVVCWSLRPGDIVPDDERLAIAEPWRYVDDGEVERRLAICDLIAIPIVPDGEMLTSGVVSDALAMGLGMLISSWEYLRESAGDAGIVCGDSVADVAGALNRLSVDDVERVKRASLTLRRRRHWDSVTGPLTNFYEKVSSDSTR